MYTTIYIIYMYLHLLSYTVYISFFSLSYRGENQQKHHSPETQEVVGAFPEQITVVSFGFKRRRFAELHRKALRFPSARWGATLTLS